MYWDVSCEWEGHTRSVASGYYATQFEDAEMSAKAASVAMALYITAIVISVFMFFFVCCTSGCFT